MNVPDLRNVDFDAYRQRAAELRQQAINEFIDSLVARMTSLLPPRRHVAAVRAEHAATCAA
jgi:hypothetical protein